MDLPGATHRIRTGLDGLRRVLLPGRTLAVFLGVLLLLLSVLSVGNFLSDGAAHAVRLHNLVHEGSLEIVEIPDPYFTHAELFKPRDAGFVTGETGGLAYLSLPAWGVLAAGSLVGMDVFMAGTWSAVLLGWLRTEPYVRRRVPRRAAAGLAAGLFPLNVALTPAVAFDVWGAMLAVQVTSVVAVAFGAAAVHRIARARFQRMDLAYAAPALLVVGPVAFWAVGAKEHGFAVGGIAVAFAAFFGYHRTRRLGYRLGTYAVLAVTVWVAGPYGLIALAAVALVDLGMALVRPSRSRVREIGLVLVLATLAAMPYPVDRQLHDVGAGISDLGPDQPTGDGGGGGDGGSGGDGGGTGDGGGGGGDGGTGDGGDGTADGGGGGPILPGYVRTFLDPIVAPLAELLETWVARPLARLGDLLRFTLTGTSDPELIPLFVVSPALAAALFLGLPRLPGALAEVLMVQPPRLSVLEAGLGVFVLLHLFAYVPWTAEVNLKTFDQRFLLALYVPLSLLAVRALRSDLADRVDRFLLAAGASSVALVVSLVALFWSSGLDNAFHLFVSVRLLGAFALAGLVIAFAHDRLRRPGALPYALAFAVAVSALWLFAATVAFPRGVPTSEGGSYWLGLTQLLQGLLL